MTAPVRLQLSRKKGFNLQEHSRAVNGLDAVNVARPSRWGNPYRVGDRLYDDQRRNPISQQDAVDLYERRECGRWRSAEIARELKGRNLACWSAPDQPCPADILLERANRPLKGV